MFYRRLTAYYLTGTGNSRHAARWFAEAAESRGMTSHVAALDAAQPSTELADPGGHLFAFFLPTHGFTAPWAAIKFALRRLPRGRGIPAVVVAARAGWRLGPWCLPGLSATAAFVIALILWLRGYRPRGVTGLDLPSNWLSLHPGFSETTVNKIYAANRPRMERIYAKWLDGRTHWLSVSNVYDLLFGLALLPITVAYVLIGRFFLAKIFFATHRCTGCGLCASHCPVGAIRMRGPGKKRPYWSFDCESCMRCMSYCPHHAIEAHQGLAVGLTWLMMVPAGYVGLVWLFDRMPGGASVLAIAPLAAVVGLAYLYLVAYLVGWLLYWLTRVPLLDRLVMVTTLTWFYRRYHAPETRYKDLKRSESKETPTETSVET